MNKNNEILDFKIQVNHKKPVSWSAAVCCVVVAPPSCQMAAEFAVESAVDRSSHEFQQNRLAGVHDH